MSRLEKLVVGSVLGSLLAMPILADHKPNHGKGGGGDGGGGNKGEVLFKVDVVGDPVADLDAPIYSPTCSAFTIERKGPHRTYLARYEQVDPDNPCDDVELLPPEGSPDYTLTHGINLMLTTDDDGCLTSFQLRGRTVSGEENTVHESEIATFTECVTSDLGFTLHVDRSLLPIWSLTFKGKKRVRVEIVGEISVGDLIYTPLP